MIAILSIKVKYVEKILNGNKKYEFRKTSFKRDVKKILVYATKPTSAFVCFLDAGEIIEDEPENLWRDFGEFSGLEKKEFFDYFGDRDTGVAIEIKKVEEFSRPIKPEKIFPEFMPPQSWIYVPAESFIFPQKL